MSNPLLWILCLALFSGLFTRVIGIRFPRWGTGVTLIAHILILGFASHWAFEYLLTPFEGASEKLSWLTHPTDNKNLVTLSTYANQTTVLWTWMVSLLSFLIVVFSLFYQKQQHARYYSWISLFTASLLAFVSTTHLIVLFILWELIGLCSYFMINFERTHTSSQNANLAFLTNRIGDGGFLIGLLSLGALFGHFDLTEMSQLVTQNKLAHSPLLGVGLFGMLVAALTKSAQFPFWFWLPRAMTAPTPMSAYLHAATLVASGALLLYKLSPLLTLTPYLLSLIGFIGGASIILGGALAFFADELKEILAYSTISQLGYVFLAFGLSLFSVGEGHLSVHVFFKAGLFLAVGHIVLVLKQKKLSQVTPLTAFSLTGIGVLLTVGSLLGLPGFSGGLTKGTLASYVIQLPSSPLHVWVQLCFFGGIILTAAYSLRFYCGIFKFPFLRASASVPNRLPASGTLGGVVLILGLLSLGIWYFALMKTSFFVTARNEFTAVGHEGLWVELFCLVIGLGLGTLSHFKVFGSPPQLLTHDWPHMLWQKILRGLSLIFFWIEQNVIEGCLIEGFLKLTILLKKILGTWDLKLWDKYVIDSIAKMTSRAGKLVQKIQGGHVQIYMMTTLTVLVTLLFWVLR